jgi:Mg2+-importing ATPase
MGLKKGREVFSNTVKYIKVTLASNFGNFFAVAVASLLSSTLPMLPLQILLLNLLSDFPMIAMATDRVDPGELTSPKKYQVHQVIALATVLGVISSFFDFTFFALFTRQGPQHLQTYWFIGSVLTELIFIYSIRVQRFFLKSVRPGIALAVLSISAALASVILPFTHFGQQVFEFIRPDPLSLIIILFIVLMYFVVTEAVKLAYYSFARNIATNG